MIIFNFPTKSMQFCAIKAFIKFKWIILMERKKTIIILAAAAVSTTIEKRFLFDFHIICRSAGIFFSKKNDDSVQRYNSSDGDTTFDKWWIVDDFLRWSPHYTRVISTSFVQLYGSWRDSILLLYTCTATIWIIIVRDGRGTIQDITTTENIINDERLGGLLIDLWSP